MVAAEGWTPVLLRANTGLSLRENGVALTALLQGVVDAWPARSPGSRWSGTRWAA